MAKSCNDNKAKLTDPERLSLYGYYKQAMVGDINVAPSEDPVAKAKFEAWSKHKGMDKGKAMEEYIKLGTELLQKAKVM